MRETRLLLAMGKSRMRRASRDYSSPSPTAAASPWPGVCLRGNVSLNASSSGSLPPALGRLHVAAATPLILASRLARTGHVGAP